MNKQKPKSLPAKLLDLITYKKSTQPKKFVLPETDEGQPNQSARRQGNGSQKSDGQTSGDQAGGNQTESRLSGESKDRLRRRANRKPMTAAQVKASRTSSEQSRSDEVYSDIESNLVAMKQLFHVPENKDPVIREFELGNKRKGFLICLDGMADKRIINENILRPLFATLNFPDENIHLALENIIETNDTKKLASFNKVAAEILKGNTALYLDGLDFFSGL